MGKAGDCLLNRFLDQGCLAGYAEPATAVSDPGICKSSAMGVGFPVQCSSFVIRARHDYRTVVNAGKHRIISDVVDMFGWILNILEELGFCLQTAIDIGIDELVGQQMTERGSVLIDFRLVPERFQCQDSGRVAGVCC